jgi:hypothetical protein
MNAVRPYLLASISIGTLTGAVHGYTVYGLSVENILMQGLSGMVLGPYAPLVIPYVLFKCPMNKRH